jgi:hypothetical protein
MKNSSVSIALLMIVTLSITLIWQHDLNSFGFLLTGIILSEVLNSDEN